MEAREAFARASAESAARMVHAFEDCTLPRERWTHAAHLVVGLWYVLHHGRERAFELACARIERYNRASGRTPRERDGFDAGVTRRWIDRIADFADGAAVESFDDALLRRMLSCFAVPHPAPRAPVVGATRLRPWPEAARPSARVESVAELGPTGEPGRACDVAETDSGA